MKLLVHLVLVLNILACSNQQTTSETEIVYQQEDKEILEQILSIFSDEQKTPTAVLMVKVGTFFKETPYVAHTLESEKEQLVINLRELDCTTFAENCLAISKTIQSKKPSFEEFTKQLQRIRYRKGTIVGYPSRIHYFSDWIYENDNKNLVKHISEEIAGIPYPNQPDFMSTHPDSYEQLKANPELIPIIAEQEKAISEREYFYIPEENLAEFEKDLTDGDIVGITTRIEGLDISHVGILVRKAGRIHLMHASSKAEKVILSEETLEEYLLNSKTATGIMVARPK